MSTIAQIKRKAQNSLIPAATQTITAGATAQDVFDVFPLRQALFFQNHSDTDMWINFDITAVAAQPSIKILAGTGLVLEGSEVSGGKVSVICATTGKAFTAKER
jgi:hypothetical protein